MHRLESGHDGKALVIRYSQAIVSGAVAMLFLGAVPLGAARAEEAKPYRVENGRIDANTFHGWELYGEHCQRCHAPGAVGVEYPYTPALAESLKTMSEARFKQIVTNGKQCGEPLVMPSFGETPAVVLRLDDLYAYLKARADGVLGPGRPKRIGAADQ